MVNSMTGYASLQGAMTGFDWNWEIRSVNSKGLDLRLRVPDWVTGLEQTLRSELPKHLARGNVSLSLRLNRNTSDELARIDADTLRATLTALQQIEAAAAAQGQVLAPTTAMEIYAARGVMEAGPSDTDTTALSKALLADLPKLLDDFKAMRAREGSALKALLSDQLDHVETCVKDAGIEAEARKDDWARTLRENLKRVLDNSDGADPARVEQELALITVKSDVTEELDRLGAHIGAARELLATDGPIGRKLDFLMQEFNREANTLCAKVQSTALTRIGLDLKAVIDQMREQVQNVE